MKLELTAALGKIAASVAAACILGGGTMVLNTSSKASENAVRIKDLNKQQEKIDATLDRLDQSVRDLDKHVAVLNERMSKE